MRQNTWLITTFSHLVESFHKRVTIHLFPKVTYHEYLLQQYICSILEGSQEGHRGEPINFFFDLDNMENPVLWVVPMTCLTLLNTSALSGMGEFLLATANNLFISWRPRYASTKIPKHKELSLTKAPNPGVLSSIAESHLNLTGCLQHTSQTWFTISCWFHSGFLGAESINPSS